MSTTNISLVTGAGSGIGAATARRFADRGDTVVCTDIDGEAAQRTADALPSAIALQHDVASDDATAAVFEHVLETYGRVDVAVANAGLIRRGTTLTLSEDDFDVTIDVNVRGAFLTAQAAGRAMIDGDGGSIVMIGSIHSVRAMRGQPAYAASKGAVLMMSKVLALEWARHGIRVNCVGPGFTETAATAPTIAAPERLSMMMERVPMQRIGDPDEIAAAISFLTSPDASFITGAYLNADGGWLTS